MADSSDEMSSGSDIDWEVDEDSDEMSSENEHSETCAKDTAADHGLDIQWKFEDFVSREPKPYTDGGGATVKLSDEASAGNYFELFWGPEVWDRLVTETNKHAEQERARSPPSHAKVSKWTPVSVKDMKTFIGLIFYMGIGNDLWQPTRQCGLFHFAASPFSKCMPMGRFKQIWKYFHLHDNSAPHPDKSDKLRQMRWFLDHLNDKFGALYTPRGHYGVNQILFKQSDIHVLSLCEPTTGYTYRVQLYNGRNEDIQEKTLTDSCRRRALLDLLKPVKNRNIRVFMIDYYTRTALLEELLTDGIYVCGSIGRKEKGLPESLLPKNHPLEKYKFVVAQKGDLTFCSWKDSHSKELILSNYHDPIEQGTVQRRGADGKRGPVVVPKMVEEYIVHRDAMIKANETFEESSMYPMELLQKQQRCKKWWRGIFQHLQVAVACNSYIIARDNNLDVAKWKWRAFPDFLQDLVKELLGYDAEEETEYDAEMEQDSEEGTGSDSS